MKDARPPCAKCGGPHPFDTSIPSVVWNEEVRAAGLPDYLCPACILRHFAERNVSFTCELWGDGLSGIPISVHVNNRRARASQRIQAENNDLRHRLFEAVSDAQPLTEGAQELSSLREQITALEASRLLLEGERDEAERRRAAIEKNWVGMLHALGADEADLGPTLAAQRMAERDEARAAHTETARGFNLYQQAAEARENNLRSQLTRLQQERKELQEAAAKEKCDKCGRMMPRQFVAIEVVNGAPTDDPAGFQWCVVCHDIGVHEKMIQRLAKAEASLLSLREALKEALTFHQTTHIHAILEMDGSATNPSSSTASQAPDEERP